MKFLDVIETTMGQGRVVARTENGGILAAVVRQPQGGAVRRTFPHIVFSWCEAHQVWFVSGEECPKCTDAKEAGNG